MEALGRIMDQVRMTSQNLEAKKTEYQCNECQDSGWIYSKESDSYTQCRCVKIKHVKSLWNNFGVKPEETMKLAEYIPYDNITKSAKEKAINYIKSFNDIAGKKENSYGLFGQAGAGKSHIVIAIGAELLNRDIDPVEVVYMPYLEVSRELKANTNNDEYYIQVSNRYCKAKLLIIDDLFKDKMRNGQLIKGACITESDMKHIYPILNYRYLNHLPIVFSTECTPKILNELDEALAGRILESCDENITIFKGPQYNYRMRKFMK